MITLDDVVTAAAAHDIAVLGLITNDSGAALVKFVYDLSESSTIYFSSGWLNDEQQALEFAYGLMQEEKGEIMNLLKNDKLFPNIRGVMMKDKRTTLTLSGKVNVTELRGGDARLELFFLDHNKTAVINANESLQIIDVYGGEPSDWKGKPVVLYGEEGVWFGKHGWGIRVDYEATKRESKKKPAKPAAEKPVQEKQAPVKIEPFEKDIDESDLVDLEEIDAEAINLDLFGNAPRGNNYNE